MSKMGTEFSAQRITHYENYQKVHQPIAVLIDTSASMNSREDGESRRNIEIAQEMVRQIGSGEELPDEYKRTTDARFYTFNDSVRCVFGLAPLSRFTGEIQLEAGGRTSLYGALIHALEDICAIKADYRRTGIASRRPQLFCFTDGRPTDDEDLPRVRQLCREKDVALSFILLPGASPEAVLKLTEGPDEYKAKVFLYRITDCQHGLPDCGGFIQATIVAFTESAPHDRVVLELPDNIQTTQQVVREEDGSRSVYQEAVVWS